MQSWCGSSSTFSALAESLSLCSVVVCMLYCQCCMRSNSSVAEGDIRTFSVPRLGVRSVQAAAVILLCQGCMHLFVFSFAAAATRAMHNG